MTRELTPGRPWQDELEQIIQTTRSAAVLVGKDGLGPWEEPEMRASINEFVRRKLPVIPVLLPGVGDKPEMQLFLRDFTWVDLSYADLTGADLTRAGLQGANLRGANLTVISHSHHGLVEFLPQIAMDRVSCEPTLDLLKVFGMLLGGQSVQLFLHGRETRHALMTTQQKS